MSIAEDLEIVRAQEAALEFPTFNEDVAFAIGSAIIARATAEGLGIVADVRLWDRPLFFASRPGATADNSEWVRRKVFVVRTFGRSSLRRLLENNGERFLPADRGLDNRDYALHGGGFPIRVAGVGIIGAVTVSGLPERRDHMLVVDALCAHLGRDGKGLSLTLA